MDLLPTTPDNEFRELHGLESEIPNVYHLAHPPTNPSIQGIASIARVEDSSGVVSLQPPYEPLPSEILAKIFLHTMTDDRVVLPPVYTDSPWVLLRVCSQWKQVALSEHHLWNHLDVKGPRDSSVRRILTTWIPQVWMDTQTFPISLTLTISYVDFSFRNPLSTSPAPFDEDLNLRGLLSPYSHRLRSISLNAAFGVISSFIFGPPIIFSNLDTLDLRFSLRSRVRDTPTGALADFPVLQKVKVHGSLTPKAFCSYFTLSQFSWFRITHLALFITGIDYMDLKHIVKQCPNLVSLELTLNNRNPFPDPALRASTIHLHLPNLRSLVVEGEPRGHDILDHFRLPSLKNLTVETMNWMGNNIWNRSIDNMIRHSRCRLTSLSLGSFQSIPFETLFLGLTALNNLVVSVLAPIPGVVFDMMIRGELLESLECLECSTLSPNAFLRLLEYQCEHLSSSQYCGLSFANVLYKPSKNVDDLQEFKEGYGRLEPVLKASGKEVILTECDDL